MSLSSRLRAHLSSRSAGVAGLLAAGIAATMVLTLSAPVDAARPSARAAATTTVLSYPRASWTYTTSAFSNQSFWNSTDDMRVGSTDGGTTKYRSYIAFNHPSLAGSTIVSATLVLTEVWSWSCSPSPFQVWATGPISSTTTWNHAPVNLVVLARVIAAHGGSAACPAAAISVDVTRWMQNIADIGATTSTFSLQAVDETNSNQWKRFANTPTLVVVTG
jgi:hypothetical protein